jgi:deoxyribonuclease V
MKWPKTPTLTEARDLQDRLRKSVRILSLPKEIRSIAGVDAAFSDDRVFAGVCLYSFPELLFLEHKTVVLKLSFSYVPSYLSLREGPAIMAALRKVPDKPDVILVDVHGIAHPRGLGIASFIGVLLDTPTIGCAKSRLIGEYTELAAGKGSWSPLWFDRRTVGTVVRTRDRTRPLFISPGHKTDLASAIRIALDCTGSFRIPEPLRCADRLSKQLQIECSPED